MQRISSPQSFHLEAKPGVKGRKGLRDVFWKHIHEAKARLEKEHPELTKTQILEMARKEYRSQYSSEKTSIKYYVSLFETTLGPGVVI